MPCVYCTGFTRVPQQGLSNHIKNSKERQKAGTFCDTLPVFSLQKEDTGVATCEDEIIERAACGDQDAFQQLWMMHHAVAMAAALRLCHQYALAEEITQGAFLLAWRGLPRFIPGSPFRPWLMRILYRHALDVMEKQRVYQHPIPLQEVLEREIYGQTGPSLVERDMQEEIVQREEVRQALACLNADQRRVIALRYGADLMETEIAQVLGWPIGTVKSRLSRAREHLRVLLEEGKR
jgi:RNA polymerase sigma factor (sigma-70 family)